MEIEFKNTEESMEEAKSIVQIKGGAVSFNLPDHYTVSITGPVPEGASIIKKSKYTSKKITYTFEEGMWHGYGSVGQKIKETDTMQQILTKEFNQTKE